MGAPPEAGIPGWDMTTMFIGVGRGWLASAAAPSRELKDDCWKQREGANDLELKAG